MNVNVSGPGWIAPCRRNTDARARLFCFPHAGGTSSTFRDWPEQLPNLDVCVVQLPGRERRLMETPFSRMRPLVQTLARSLPWDKPFAFFGHSLGALVGFELARELRRGHLPLPFHLVVSAHAAPQVPITHTPPRYLLPDQELIAELRNLAGTQEEVLRDASMMQLVLPVLRADFAVNETYVYEPEAPLHCPITAFGGIEDREVKPKDLQAWREHTKSSFSVRRFPGGHFYLIDLPTDVLRAMSEAIPVE